MNDPRSRVIFNPTSLPGLRLQRSYIQNARVTPRKPLAKGAGQKPGLKMKSTLTGEDKSGHIVAQASEGILFFDSQFPTRRSREITWLLIISRSVSVETQLDPSSAISENRSQPS
jgi:hypothetical protein